MHAEIDMSGRLEATAQKTVIAFSNGSRASILIPPKVKQVCFVYLRERHYKPPRSYAILFATVVYLLIKDEVGKGRLYTIDREYYGHEALIKEHLSKLLLRSAYRPGDNFVRFALIGKKSAAHTLAIETFRGNMKVGRIISARELLRELKT